MKKYFLFICIVVFIAGCNSIGLKHTSRRNWNEERNSCALTTDKPDLTIHSYLVSNAYDNLFYNNPEKAFKTIKERFLKNKRRPHLSALAGMAGLQCGQVAAAAQKASG